MGVEHVLQKVWAGNVFIHNETKQLGLSLHSNININNNNTTEDSRKEVRKPATRIFTPTVFTI
jgi:hypothetical protein